MRAFEVNQLLRRPAADSTGLVVAADGLILTSLFNLGDDTAFVAKATGRPRVFDPLSPLPKLLADPPGGLERQPNPVTKLTVILPDGRRRPATVLARHDPLGIALMQLELEPGETEQLAWFNLATAVSSPLLGDAVAIVGRG